jgi:hypothetical protein
MSWQVSNPSSVTRALVIFVFLGFLDVQSAKIFHKENMSANIMKILSRI